MISLCYAGNPKNIELISNNRFKNIELIKNTGVTISWYLRPLVKEWGANSKHLKEMFKFVHDNYGEYIDMIIPGGLRWTEGIEFGLSVQKGETMPKLIKEYDKKTLSCKIENEILKLSNEYFPDKPVYFNSSCAIAHMLEKNNVALLNILNHNICSKSKCFNPSKEKCLKCKFSKEEINKIEEILKKEGINVEILDISIKNGIKTKPELETFNYTVKQQIKKEIARIIQML